MIFTMPKLYEYLGIIIFFWSNEHEPIHVHGEYQGRESKAEIMIEDGKIINITIEKVKGRRLLEGYELKNFEEFVRSKAYDIIEKWTDYFVLHKKINFEKITGKLR